VPKLQQLPELLAPLSLAHRIASLSVSVGGTLLKSFRLPSRVRGVAWINVFDSFCAERLLTKFPGEGLLTEVLRLGTA